MAGDSVLLFEAISQFVDFRYSINCWLTGTWLIFFLLLDLTFLHADWVWDIVRDNSELLLGLHKHLPLVRPLALSWQTPIA